ncbi:MAG: Ig-like domain-containing protein [Planctomycetota bacterium]
MGRFHKTTLGVIAATLAACAPSTSTVEGTVPGASGSFRILSCSLGCTSPAGGSISCSLSEVFQNQTLSFEFNKPVDPTSLSTTTVRVSRLDSGQVVPSLIEVDPVNPRKVNFRAKIAIGSDGEYAPGFEAFKTYRVFIRDTSLGTTVRATDGGGNSTRLECFVSATKGVLDTQPGPPSVQPFVEALDPVSKAVISSEPADGAVDVPQVARIRLEFDQIMDAGTLIDTVTGTSPTVKVRFDEDGDPGTIFDQVELPGVYGLAFDEAAGKTNFVFLPNPEFPSAGSDLLEPHKVIVSVSAGARDITGLPLTNPQTAVFAPVAADVPPVEVVDRFSGQTPIDLRGSSSVGEGFVIVGGAYQGRVLPVYGGGSGELGNLVVRSGETVVLSTGPTIPSRFGPRLAVGPIDSFGLITTEEEEIVAYQARTDTIDDYFLSMALPGEIPLEVDDGVFEFASLVIESGATLRFVGEVPARVFVRGIARVDGTISARGENGAQHLSTAGQGGSGARAGLGAGAGGDGGDRPDQAGGLLAAGGAFRGFNHPSGATVDVTGAAVDGRGGAAVGTDGGSGGGISWPPVFPGPSTLDLGSLSTSGFLNLICSAVEVGATGAGGSYSTSGSAGTYQTPAPAFGVPPAPPAAIASTDLLRADEIDLDPDRGGTLLGGAGGGGGGAGIQGTTTNGNPANMCLPNPPALFLVINGYLDGSGGGGGAGGGAFQFQAGRSMTLGGLVDVRGGTGSGIPLCIPVNDGCWMAPGGGGSGGALLLQTRTVDFGSATNVLDVRGGAGGVNGNTLSRGGDGGAGIMRIETLPQLQFSALSAAIQPKTGGVGQPATDDVVSIGEFAPPTQGPGRFSGFTSCWQRPDSGLFGFDFAPDDFSDADPANWNYAWNLRVELDTGEVVDWRGDSGPINDEFGMDLATLSGNSVGSSPLVVRFQGLRFLLSAQDPCNVDETLLGGGTVEDDSLTAWLASPDELDTYWGQFVSPEIADARRPNAFRVQIIFDPEAPNADRIDSVVEYTVTVQPR